MRKEQHREIERILGRINSLTETHDCMFALQTLDMNIEPDPLFISHGPQGRDGLGPVTERTFRPKS